MRKWNFFTSKEIKPIGWLKRQLEIQAEGLSGNLDKVWRDIKESAWIGGEAEGWERVPYWLDGFIPLAYLLENEDMIARAKKYIDAIIEAQQPDGWICPCKKEERPTYDTWAVQLITKVLTVYYDCSGDERIPEVIYKTLKNYYELLKSGEIKLFNWGEFRWFEAFVAINFTYEKYQEPWLNDLAKILKEQGADYSKFIETWKRPLNKWTYHTHIVNIAMMLKAEAISCDTLGEEYTDRAEMFRDVLAKYNGRPTGVFTGDECVSGISPIQGTELCAVAEQMYSYEHLFAYTGENKWAELLEKIAFNAFPATNSDDMWTHQYDQLSNQIACAKFPVYPHFRTNGPESHLFGLEPNFGCCTANMNQAWPKLALSTFMYNGDTVINSLTIPSVLKTKDLTIKLSTNYPFNNSFIYEISSTKKFDFKVRIPSFAEELTVNGKKQSSAKELTFNIAEGETKLEISFRTKPKLVDASFELKVAECGSLIFALPIKYEKVMHEYVKDNVERKFPYCDYELFPKSDWNYGFAGDEFELEEKNISNMPFSSENPPVVLKAKVKKIDWGYLDGYETVCAKVPESTKAISEEETVELYPYGCTMLRMTEMPIVD